jgi:hypothetical protein
MQTRNGPFVLDGMSAREMDSRETSTMAADSSSNDTQAAAQEGDGQPSSEAPASKPRPPRPAKRASGPVRAPSSSPLATPRGSEPMSASSEDSAPPVPLAIDAAFSSPALLEAENNELEIPLTRARSSSAAPSISIEQAETDPADRPTTAPKSPKFARAAQTGSHAVARVLPARAPDEAAPEVARKEEGGRREKAFSASPLAAAFGDDDREDTLVGAVPKRLLELTAHTDENTRAYQAPRELLELARRQREERLAARTAGNSASPAEGALGESDDAAPPVARSQGPQGEAHSLTPRPTGGAPAGADDREAADSEGDPDSFPAADEPPVVRDAETSPRAFKRAERGSSGSLWALVIAVIFLAAYSLARWRGAELARWFAALH